MRIFLIGYRGAGKSTVGKILSERLNLPFYSLDQQIEEKAGKTIAQIVEEKGWDSFRDLETRVLKEALGKEGIIDCGGGVVEREENRELLKTESGVFFLKTSIETIRERLADKTDRPSLTGENFLEEAARVYQRRMPFYESTARFIVEADGGPEEVADAVQHLLLEQFPF